MSSDALLGLLLRILPAIAVCILGVIAGSDRRTREQWTNLLYQAGSLRPDQRGDAKIQSRVRIPFFIVAVLLLVWPVKYYFWATRVIQVTEQSDIYKKQTPQLGQTNAASSNTANGNTANSNTASGTAPASNAANSLTAPNSANAANSTNAAGANAVTNAAPAPADPSGPHL